MTTVSDNNIQHVNLMVGDLDAAVAFYTEVLGLDRAPTPPLDFPAQFIAVNDYQQIHLNQLPDITPERAHFCMRVGDFSGVFRRAKAAGVIETRTWGHARRLDSRGHAAVRARSRGQPHRDRLRRGSGGRRRGPRRRGVRGRRSMIVLLESVHPDAAALLERSDEVHLAADPLVVDATVPAVASGRS